MKTILSFLITTCLAWNIQSQEEFIFHYPAADKIFVFWDADVQEDEFIGVYKLSESKNKKGIQETLIYWSEPVVSGNDIRMILGDRYDYVAGLLDVGFPEEIPYKMKELKHLETLICGLIPEMAVVQGKGYIDNLVVEGQQYEYKLVKMRKKGKKPIAIKELAHFSVKAEDLPVLPPIFLEIKGGENQVELYFSNNTTPAAGINIFRSEEKNGPYSKINQAMVYIPENETGMPSFTDLDVIPGETYWYTLQSYDIFGNPSTYSDTLNASSYGCDISEIPEMEKISYEGKDYYLSWNHQYSDNVARYNIYVSDNYSDIGKMIRSVDPKPEGRYKIPLKIIDGNYRYYTISAVSKDGKCEIYSLKQIYRPAKF